MLQGYLISIYFDRTIYFIMITSKKRTFNNKTQVTKGYREKAREKVMFTGVTKYYFRCLLVA